MYGNYIVTNSVLQIVQSTTMTRMEKLLLDTTMYYLHV